ncbi:hypothetical protein AN189_17605 [Loktanella sp. 3ANDIMAR09]|uniref:hypothetical protein n=1 Tax=Loktanella sp. 3ANDIMAR09 TaxID=1225657 RepID=UPI0006F6C291|nr:hypothetical protein [Loktanella sp. 3ANDIMAR09]KQI67040.1 hypothetical protein AN189_17605 [Loktanella sp. 3ANDIMAR09]
MKIAIEDATGLPEWLQSHVSEGHLDLAAVPVPEDVTGLKTALQKERENAQVWSRFGKPDDVAKRIAELEEKAKGTGKGAEDAQAKLDAMKNEYEGKLTEAQGRIQKMMQTNAQASLKAELAKAGFIPEAIDDIAMTAMGRLQFNDDGTPKVLTSDGKPMIGSGADHGATLTDLAKELAASKPYAVRDDGKGGSGKQPGTNGGTPTRQTVTRSAFDAMSQTERAAFSKTGGKVVD